MNIKLLLVKKVLRTILPIPARARHCEYSAIFSADDAVSRPSGRLLDLALEAVRAARGVSLKEISARMKTGPFYPEVWPGENYKLLAGLALALKPGCVVEIGTYTGLSALTLRKFLPPASRLFTFDIAGWRSFADTCFLEEDFSDGRLVQHLSNLADPAEVSRHGDLLKSADLVFLDAPKDGVTEQKFLDNFRKLGLKKGAILVFDDIRLWNMLKIWRELSLPKLDLTSFGHWSGTGLAEWE